MAIDEAAYRALEDVVGPEHITREPVVLDTYCYIWANEVLVGDKFSARPLAVVMPASTEEIQAIVRVCKRYGVRCRPFASGFETAALTAPAPMLCIDLRRMNRILSIDRRNRVAIVEPYVSQTALFIEAMKVGLRPNMIGAGSSASVLAGTAAHFGSGPTNISTDFGGRNLLGIEWVLPDGDVLRLGPLADSKPVNADGPGPSLRGIVRGYGGANGGLGVFTKCAVKLYPWYGPPLRKPEGTAPNFGAEVPENFEDFCVAFPSRQALSDFQHLLYEETIAFAQERPGLAFIAMQTAETNDEFYAMIKDVPEEMKKIASYSMLLSLDAGSAREMQYKRRVLEELLQRTGGMSVPLDEKIKGSLFNGAVTAHGTVRAAFRPAGSFVISPVAEDTIDSVNEMAGRAHDEIIAGARATGEIADGVPETVWAVIYGSDGCGHVEVLTQYDPADPASCSRTREVVEKADKKVAEWGYGVNLLENALSYREASLTAAAPYAVDFVKWMKKIKKAYDPDNVAESAFYVSPE